MWQSITLGGVGLGDFSIDSSTDSEWLGTTMDEVAEIPKRGFLSGILLRHVIILGATQAKPSGSGSYSSDTFNSESAMLLG